MSRGPTGIAVVSHAQAFIREKVGRRAFAPLTGQDFAAWRAFVLLVDLLAIADRTGRAAAIAAMGATLAAAQRAAGVHVTFALAIAAVTTWDDVAALWPRLDGIPLDELGIDVEPTRDLANGGGP